MTKKERVLCALRFEQTDRPPCNVFLTAQAAQNMQAYTHCESFEKQYLDNHITMAAYDGFARPTQCRELFVDDFGVQWDRSGADKDIGVVRRYRIERVEDYDSFCLPPVPERQLRNLFEKALIGAGDTFRMGAIGFTLFERAWSLRGMENLLMDMIEEPQRVDALLDAICEYDLRVLDIALSYEWDGFHFGDDWGQQRGLIMGPHLWRRFIKPRMARLYARVKEKGLWVSQHSCGDLKCTPCQVQNLLSGSSSATSCDIMPSLCR